MDKKKGRESSRWFAAHDCLDDRTDDELTDELRYKWSFCPIVTKEKEGYVSMFVPGGNVIRFKDKEATRLIFDAIMRSFDRV